MQSHFRIQTLKMAYPHITINPFEHSEPTQGLCGFDLHLYLDISPQAKTQTCILFHLSMTFDFPPWKV